MRVSSLVALAVVVLVILYFVFLTPEWAIDLYMQATGYGPAKTPTEAVDKFLKAVKARDLRTASRFCTAGFAEQLKRGHTAAREMGPLIDSIYEYAKNKGLWTDKVVDYLVLLDPFPKNLLAAGPPKEVDDSKAIGFVKIDNIWPENTTPQFFAPGQLHAEWSRLDPRMFSSALFPRMLVNPKGFPIVKEGSEWKLDLSLPSNQMPFVEHYLKNYKAYHTGLSIFRRDLTNDRFDSKKRFEGDLIAVMQDAK
ncbi:MAG: hypothetical protein NZO58_01605 [Gemmataceae bacterium]|nr:hypothetical protein [Gemmataceae bacterium]